MNGYDFPSNLPIGRKRLSRVNYGPPSVHPVGRKQFSRCTGTKVRLVRHKSVWLKGRKSCITVGRHLKSHAISLCMAVNGRLVLVRLTSDIPYQRATQQTGIYYASTDMFFSYHSLGIGSTEIQRSRSAFSQIPLQVSVIFLQSQTYTNAFPSLEYVTAPEYSNASL